MKSDGKPSSRRSARLAAVQAIYQIHMSGDSPSRVMQDFVEHYFSDEETVEAYFQPNVDLFKSTVLGVTSSIDKLNEKISEQLVAGWTLDRVVLVILCVLQCGAYELIFHPEIPTKVIITEYVEISKSFCIDRDAAFVNRVLDNITREVR